MESYQKDGFVFFPTQKEMSDGKFHLLYSCALDCYERVSNDQEKMEGWQKWAWRKETMFRKVEHDWKTAYIARTEGSSTGKVSWKFDCGPMGLKMGNVEVRVASQTNPTGKVILTISSGQKTIKFPGDGKLHSVPSFSGVTELIVGAELISADGGGEWKDAQLFPQSLTEPTESSFEIIIELKEPEGFVFVPTPKEKSDGKFQLTYSCAADCYQRGEQEMDGWEHCVWSKEKVFRKVEYDWTKVYIARTEGSKSGKISWKFDSSLMGLKMGKVEVKATTQTFNSGRVQMMLISGSNSIVFQGDGKMHSYLCFSGSTELIVEAELTGGKLPNAWEDAQLFRQGLPDPNQPSFEIMIQLMKE